MSTGDPFYCFEHKCFMWVCAHQRHSSESEAEFVARREHEARAAHPKCPDCRCSTAPLLIQNWRM